AGAAPKTSASDTNEKKKTNSARDLYHLGDRRSSRAQKEAAKEGAKEAEDATSASSEKTLPNESVTSELGEEGEGTE
ncbi:MAG: sec-independent translocation protein MttA, partial [Lancefieldella rimae]